MNRRGAGAAVLAAAGALLLILLPAAPAGAQEEQADDTNGRTITREARDPAPVTDAMLRDPDPGDWLMSHRTYDLQGFSPLDEINRGNVHQLQLAWMRAMDEGPLQIRPLVYDGVMYVEHPGDDDHLQAWDASTTSPATRRCWRWTRAAANSAGSARRPTTARASRTRRAR